MAKRKQKSFSQKIIPLWLAIFISFDSLLLGAILDRTFAQKQLRKLKIQLSQSENPEEFLQGIQRRVLPADGYATSLSWGDLGLKLVEVGAIDSARYREIFNSDTNGKSDLDILTGTTDKKIAINENNSRLIVNTLWALGLVNKSQVLDEGPMMSNPDQLGNFASTGGWTLGTKPAVELYSSQELIPLTPRQQELVKNIAENVYRPCCGNHTAFPDCNHGMAALGYIELAVSQGLSEEQIYQDLLAMNSFWFPTTYVEMAVYFQKEKEISWPEVDPKTALSQEYSSAQGAAKIREAVQNVPGLQSQGGSCGA